MTTLLLPRYKVDPYSGPKSKGFAVINVETSQVQSVWPSLERAMEVMRSLNKFPIIRYVLEKGVK